MADIKITDLAAYTDPVSTDVLPIVDVGSDLTKKVSIADLLKNVLLVDSNGDVEIGGGNTQLNADGEALFSGPVSIGGTAAANQIDEYETGSWVPVIKQFGTNVDIPFTTVNASYVRVGNQVSLQFAVTLTSSSNSATLQPLIYGHTIFGNPVNRCLAMLATITSVDTAIGYSAGTNFTFRSPGGAITCGATDSETLIFATTFIVA
jgi:hypothetical protein